MRDFQLKKTKFLFLHPNNFCLSHATTNLTPCIHCTFVQLNSELVFNQICACPVYIKSEAKSYYTVMIRNITVLNSAETRQKYTSSVFCQGRVAAKTAAGAERRISLDRCPSF
jgi:hypothetical protein